MKRLKISPLFVTCLLILLISQGMPSALAQGSVSDRTIVIDDNTVRIYNAAGQIQGGTVSTNGRADVVTTVDRIVVIDNSFVRIFNAAGQIQGGTVSTNGRADVVTTVDRIVVIDNSFVRIFNAAGQIQGGTVSTNGRADVVTTVDRIVVIDNSFVRIFNAAGQIQGGTVSTNGRADVVTTVDRIVVIDNSFVRIFNAAGQIQGGTVSTNGRADVVTTVDRIVVIDNSFVRIFNAAGQIQGGTVSTNGRADVVTTVDRIVVIDNSFVRIFNAAGQIQGGTVSTNGRADVVTTVDRIVVIDNSFVRIFNAAGQIQGGTISTNGRADVVTTVDRIVVIDNSFVRIFNAAGQIQGGTVSTNGRADVVTTVDRIVVIDNSFVRIFNAAGQIQGGTVSTNGRADVVTTVDRIVVIDNSFVRIFNAAGQIQGGTVSTNGRADVVTTVDRIVVIDNSFVRIFNAAGQIQGGTVSTNGRADVIGITNFIIAISNSTVRIYNILGSLILSANTNGQANVITCPDSFNIIDNTLVRIYNLSGSLLVSSTINGQANVIACRTSFSPLNHAPHATNDTVTTAEDMAVTIPVLNNDTDPDNDPLTVTNLTTPTHGRVTKNGTSATYTPALNFNGPDSFIYTVSDGDLTDTASVVVTVTAVNDAPSFIKGADQTVNEDAGPQTVANWATNISAGPANESGQTLIFNLTNNHPSLFASQPAIAPNGTLTYQPTANANGNATVTVTLKDNGGAANGGVDTSLPQTFTIVVNPVNDPPSFTKGPDQTISPNTGAQVVPNWAINISVGPANENSQSLTFSLTNNNPGLFASQPALTANGTLTYQPAANANGSALVTITLKDDGSTANGGLDTSPPQTFSITFAQPVILQASIALQGRPAQPNPAWAIPLSVTLTLAGGSTPAYSFNPTLDQQGQFTLAGIIPGQYDIRVKGNHTLRNLASNVNLAAGSNPYYLGTLLEGDIETITTFNSVELADFEPLAGSFNQCAADAAFMVNADLNENGCVTLADFGLLSGNFNKQGDIVLTATVGPPPLALRPAGAGQALLTFNVSELAVTVDEVVTVSVEVDPRGAKINGAMVHLRFDPTLVEVMAVNLSDALPLVLVKPVVDNQQGLVQFGRGLLGQTLTDKFTLATLAVKVKATTPGTTITPVVDALPTTDLSGPEGGALGEIREVTLKTKIDNQHIVFLPIVINLEN